MWFRQKEQDIGDTKDQNRQVVILGPPTRVIDQLANSHYPLTFAEVAEKQDLLRLRCSQECFVQSKMMWKATSIYSTE